MNLQFEHIEYIVLLAAIPVIWILFFALTRWKRKVRKRVGDKKLVKSLIGSFSPGRFALKFVMLSIGFAAGAVALMNPREPGATNNSSRKGIDVVIALDVSKSMLATDLQPSRLERAKQFITRLLNEMPDDRIGLVLFAGRAYLQMPLTIDHGAASLYLSSAGPEAVPQQGTVISEALLKSAAAFNTEERRFKAVVLITDGEDHDENAAKTAKELSTQGVMINCIGIGSAEGSTLVDPVTGETKKDETGTVVVSRLNEQILKDLSAQTNGIYIHLQSSDDAVAQLKDHLSQIDRKAFGDVALMDFTTYYAWLAGLMFVCLLLEILVPEIRKVKA